MPLTSSCVEATGARDTSRGQERCRESNARNTAIGCLLHSAHQLGDAKALVSPGPQPVKHTSVLIRPTYVCNLISPGSRSGSHGGLRRRRPPMHQTLPERSTHFPCTPHVSDIPRRGQGLIALIHLSQPQTQARSAEQAIPSSDQRRATFRCSSSRSVIRPPAIAAMSTQTQSVSPAAASAQFTYQAAAAAAASTPSYFPVPFHLQNAQYTTWPAAVPVAPAVAPVPAYNAVYPMPQVQQVCGNCTSPFLFRELFLAKFLRLACWSLRIPRAIPITLNWVLAA